MQKVIRKSRQAGFTLVEIAIVLVIVGLLLAGVLKGQELIENAKIKNLQNDFQGIAAAHYAYMDRYGQIAGDDSRASGASGRWGTPTAPTVAPTATGLGNGQLAGNFNQACANTSPEENCHYWYNLRKAGLISGEGTGSPRNAYGGGISIHLQTTVSLGAPVGLNLCMTGIPAKAAEAIDATYDDGRPNTGNVRATMGPLTQAPSNTAGTASGEVPPAYVDNGSNQFTVCKVL